MTTLHHTFARALAHHQAGRLAEAEAIYRRIQAVEPRHLDSLHLLGVAVHQDGRPDEAIVLIGRAIAANDGVAAFHHNLAEVLRTVGRLDEAVTHYRRAVELDPDWADAHNHLGIALQELGWLDEAAASYRRALELAPDDATAHNNLGVALQDQGRLAEAEASFRRALALDPDYADARNNLGNSLKEQGRSDAAVECYERMLADRPDLAFARSNLLFTRMALPGTTLVEIAAAAACWDAVHAEPFRAGWPTHGPADHPYRLGFVSGDFRRHAVGFLTIAALEALARAGHRFVCYNNNLTDDALTARFQAAASEWRPILGRSDDAVAEMIRADGVDILIDLSGHTAQNRLLVFARKPAPVQMTWAGYVATTGLAAMDYWLADAHQAPESAEPWYREKIIRLPASYICWEPPEEAPPVSPLPAGREGPITFGSFNFLSKVTPETIAVWSRLLGRVAGSRLLFKATSFNCPATRERYRALFAAHGVGAERLRFVGATGRPEHLAITAEADIALDSFPYSGGLTTLETLWMGVPVITRPGETLCSRHSTGYLRTVGLGELVAEHLDGYVEAAAALARDRERLAALRAGLRGRMLASPLCDAAAFARDFAAACSIAWQTHRAGRPPRSFSVVPSS